MKRIFKVLALVFMLFLLLFGFACKSSTKTPKTNYEKVQFAFNGVEKSLKSDNKKLLSDNNKPNLVKMAKSLPDRDVNLIFNFLSVEKETSDPDFKYDEPPMIQFQYIKALYEEIGDGFEFNTKYKYTITGEVKYDFDKRASTSTSVNHQYTLVLSLLINIDDEDFITAQVDFDITYQNNGDIHHQKRYSEIYLSYDMNNSNPTYGLEMFDLDDCLSFEKDNEKYNNIEYDYVNVKEGSIKEWRKFGVCSPTIIDSSNYPNLIYKYSVLRGYKDNKLYKLTDSFNKDQTLKEKVIKGFDFHLSYLARDTFNNYTSIENEKIETVYKKFNDIYGKDIIYQLVYTGATEVWEEKLTPTGIRLMNVNLDGGFENETIGIDCAPTDIFTNPNVFDNYNPYLYLIASNGKLIKEIKDYENIKFAIQDDGATDNKFHEINDENLSVAITKYLTQVYAFKLRITYGDFSTIVRFYIGEELLNAIKHIWPQAFIEEKTYDNALPVLNSNNGLYELSYDKINDKEQYELIIVFLQNVTNEEINAFCTDLLNLNYIYNSTKETYTRNYNGKFITVMVNNGRIHIRIEKGKDTAWPTNTILKWFNNEVDNIPEFNGSNYYLITDNENKMIRIYNSTQDERNNYISNLEKASTFNKDGNYYFSTDSKIYLVYTDYNEFEGYFVLYLPIMIQDRIRMALIGSSFENGMIEATQIGENEYELTVTLNEGDTFTLKDLTNNREIAEITCNDYDTETKLPYIDTFYQKPLNKVNFTGTYYFKIYAFGESLISKVNN